jgi:hypothetical protein
MMHVFAAHLLVQGTHLVVEIIEFLLDVQQLKQSQAKGKANEQQMSATETHVTVEMDSPLNLMAVLILAPY